MISKDSLVKVLRVHNDVTGKACSSEFIYGRVHDYDERYTPPVLVEVVLPSKDETVNFYRFWTEKDTIKDFLNIREVSDTVNPFGY